MNGDSELAIAVTDAAVRLLQTGLAESVGEAFGKGLARGLFAETDILDKVAKTGPALADALGAIVKDFDNDNPAKDFGLLIDAARAALRAAGRLP